MRKLYIFWGSMLSLPFAAAQQPITLEKSPISVFLIIPAIVILLLLIVLLVATFKQQITRFFVSFMSLRRMFSRIRLHAKIEPAEKQPEGISREQFDGYMTKVSSIEKQISSAAPDDSFKSFTFVAKDFFSKLIGADHTYTDEEIAAQLEKKRKSLVEFSEKLSQMKYSGHQPSKDEVVQLINQFKSIVSTHIRREKEPVRTSASRNLIAKVIAEDKKIYDSIKQYVEYLKHEDKKKQIQDLLEGEQKVMKTNIQRAKSSYDGILKLYVQLPPEEKKRIYPKLIEFYDNVNKMIFSSVYSKKGREELSYFSKELERLREAPEKPSFLKRFTEIPSSLPKLGKSAGEMPKAPEVPKLPEIKAVKKPSGTVEIRLKIPKFRLPRFHLPKISIPKLRMPSMHKERAQEAAAPKVKLPRMPVPKHAKDLELPKLKFPRKEIELPKQPMKIARPSIFSMIKGKFFAPKIEPKKSEQEEEAQKGLFVSEPVFEELSAKLKQKEEPALSKKPAPVVLPLPPRPEKAAAVSVKAKKVSEPARAEQELQELEKIKSVIKEKPVSKPRPTKLQSEEEMIVDKINQLIASVPREIEKIDHMETIRRALAKAESQLSAGDYTDAEITYECIKPVFIELSEQEKREAYQKLLDFNRKLTAALAARRIVKETVKAKPDATLSDEEKVLIEKLEQLKGVIS